MNLLTHMELEMNSMEIALSVLKVSNLYKLHHYYCTVFQYIYYSDKLLKHITINFIITNQQKTVKKR